MQKWTRMFPLWLVKNVSSLPWGFQISCVVFSLYAGGASDLASSEVPSVLVESTLCQGRSRSSVMCTCGDREPPDNLSLLSRPFSALWELSNILKAGDPSCLSQGVQSSCITAFYYYLLQNISEIEMFSGLAHSISSFKQQAPLEWVKEHIAKL